MNCAIPKCNNPIAAHGFCGKCLNAIPEFNRKALHRYRYQRDSPHYVHHHAAAITALSMAMTYAETRQPPPAPALPSMFGTTQDDDEPVWCPCCWAITIDLKHKNCGGVCPSCEKQARMG